MRAGDGQSQRRRQDPLPPLPAQRRVEAGPDGYDYEVRPVPGARATKTYRCPGCDHEIRSGTAHVVVWPADLGESAVRGPPALAHAVLGQPCEPRPDEKVVLGQCSSAAGSTSSMSTPPASLGWMKLIREFAVPRRGAS